MYRRSSLTCVMKTEIKGDNPVATIILMSACNEQNEVVINTKFSNCAVMLSMLSLYHRIASLPLVCGEDTA